MSTDCTVSEVSQRLNVSAQQIRSLCREQKLAARKVGTNWLIDESSLKDYLANNHPLQEDHVSTAVKTKKPIALSFFSGAMGLDLGIEKAGFDIRLASEIDKSCRATITANKPEIALIGNICDYTAKDIRQYARLSPTDTIDLVFGGPPCQAFSTAGSRKGFEDVRGNVFLTFVDMILKLKPNYFVIENVRGLLSSPLKHRPFALRGEDYPPLDLDELPGGALNLILSQIRNAGYAYSFNLYNAAYFGVPQSRERIVIIGSRNGITPPYLVPTHASDIGGYSPFETFRNAVQGLSEHHHLEFPEKRIRYYKMLGEGQNWKSLPVADQKEALGKSYYLGGGKTGFLRRLAWDKPSPTLVTNPTMPATDLAHPEENRPLSIEEYRRIQQFPDSWEITGSLLNQYKQIGNAVPVGLGESIGKLVMALIEGNSPNPPVGFRYSRYKDTTETQWQKKFEESISKHQKKTQASLFEV